MIILNEGFEGSISSITARWPNQSYSTFPNTGGPFNIVNFPVYNGTQSLRYNYVGTQYDTPPQGGGSAYVEYHNGVREIWLTWYSFMETGFKTAGGNGLLGVATKGLYSYMYSPSTGQTHGWVFHYFYGGRQLTLSAQGIKDARGPVSGGSQLVPYDTENMWNNVQSYSQPDNQWVCYEAHFKLNTPGVADGVYELYVTPVTAGIPTFLASRYINREFVDSNNSGQMPGDSYWYRTSIYRQDGLGYMYLDNLTVSDTRVGSGGAPPADTIPPFDVTFLSVTPGVTFLDIAWNSVTDNPAGPVTYLLQSCTGENCTGFSNDVIINSTNYTVSALAPSTTMRFRVKARDSSGNLSTNWSPIGTGTVPAADITPPSKPSSLTVR